VVVDVKGIGPTAARFSLKIQPLYCKKSGAETNALNFEGNQTAVCLISFKSPLGGE
jgi:hypothetical protein